MARSRLSTKRHLIALVVMACAGGCKRVSPSTGEGGTPLEVDARAGETQQEHGPVDAPIERFESHDVLGTTADRSVSEPARSANPVYTLSPCSQSDPSAGPLFANVECGRLEIPPADGSEGAMLPVLRLTPRTLDKKADPVIVLAGGPGQTAISLLRALYLERPFLTLLAARDVIGIGFRGTEGAEPDFVCTETKGVDFSNKEVVGGLADDLYASCRDRLSANGSRPFARYGSRQDALDVVAVVEAMNLESWNVYALSYGTRAALDLLSMNPHGLRAVVLDSPVPSNVALVTEGTIRSIEVLGRVIADCRASSSCEASFPDLTARLERVLDRFAAHPERRRLRDGTMVTIDESRVLSILESLLSFRQGAEQIPRIVGDLDADLAQVDIWLEAIAESSRTISDGLYLSVACREIPLSTLNPAVFEDPLQQKLARASHASEAFERLCRVWGVGHEASRAAVASAIPTLLLSGELDPSIRPEWAVQAGAGLSSAQVLIIPGEAHVPGESLCGAQAVESFMAMPREAVSLPCLSERRPLRFAGP
jgi:pimeloyl-ACP methyl ester carboxylesterase